jgi:uncharacterized protein with GYD domain
MAKFLVSGNYTSDGAVGLMKEGGTSRVKTVETMVGKFGGTIEAFYYAFGDYDVFAIIEVPDSVTAAAMSIAINSSGMVEISLTPLLSPAEIDEASEKTVDYRAPGS